MRYTSLIVHKIKKAERIAISCHRNPDGDSIGSILALGLGLKRLGKRVYMVSRDGVPTMYRKLPGSDHIIRTFGTRVDLAIAVDCNTKEMLGETFEVFRKAGDILEIDHHEFRRPFGTLSLIDHKAAAVGEMVYTLLSDLNVDITQDIATNILTSIIVETNSFKLPNIRPFTFQVCADLVDKGIDFYALADMVYWSKTKEAAILSGICLSRCRFLQGDRLVWSIIRKNDFKKMRGKDEDVDAVADEMRSIKNVRIVALLREKSSTTLRVSLRSKEKINVAGVAESFGGGGHYDVAGCFIPNNLAARNKLLRRLAALL